MEKIVAIVVTYNPEISVVFRLLDALASQVDSVVIVDNGSEVALAEAVQARANPSECFLPLHDNFGIAEAQNRGIEQARIQEASHVILFDQDSAPAVDMVSQLMRSWHGLCERGLRVGSIGPCYMDERQDNPPPFIRVKTLSLTRCLVPEVCQCASVDYLIASGCLIPMSVLDEVGAMNTHLFIDYVDIEWGLRARSKGNENFGCFTAKMHHSLGDEPIWFRGKAYPAHSPLRHYYLFRNAVHLYKMPHIPLDWKLADAWRLLLKFGFYSLFAKPRWHQFRMMSLGLLHGIVGRMGKL